jgi:hypothetical protein
MSIDKLSERTALCFLEALHAGICLGIFVAVVLEGGVAAGL